MEAMDGKEPVSSFIISSQFGFLRDNIFFVKTTSLPKNIYNAIWSLLLRGDMATGYCAADT